MTKAAEHTLASPRLVTFQCVMLDVDGESRCPWELKLAPRPDEDERDDLLVEYAEHVLGDHPDGRYAPDVAQSVDPDEPAYDPDA